MLSNGSDFFDVTLVWSDYMDRGAKKQNQQEKRAISSEFHFGAEILTKQL